MYKNSNIFYLSSWTRIVPFADEICYPFFFLSFCCFFEWNYVTLEHDIKKKCDYLGYLG